MALSPKQSTSNYNRWGVIWNMDWTEMNYDNEKEISNFDKNWRTTWIQ